MLPARREPLSEFNEVEPSDEQKRTAIYRHVDRDMLHALIRRGKDEKWIARWLEQRYPLEDEFGQPHANATEHRKWLVTAPTIAKYRKEWMPEAETGVDVIHSGLEKIIGMSTPPMPGQIMEIDILEASIAVAQHNMARALEQDEDMGMLQPITLEAHKALMESARLRAKVAQDLSLPGYEKAAEKQIIEQHGTNTNLNVNVDGTVSEGQLRAKEPQKVTLMKRLMELPPDEARQLVKIAGEAVDEAVEGVSAQVVDAEVVDDRHGDDPSF